MHSYWAVDVKVLYKNRAKMVVPCYNCSPFSLLENLCHMWKFLTTKQYVTRNMLIYSSLVIRSFKHSFIQSMSFIRPSVASSEYKVELRLSLAFNNFSLWGDGRGEECQPCRPVISSTGLRSLVWSCVQNAAGRGKRWPRRGLALG